jgi:hypothetical protein
MYELQAKFIDSLLSKKEKTIKRWQNSYIIREEVKGKPLERSVSIHFKELGFNMEKNELIGSWRIDPSDIQSIQLYGNIQMSFTKEGELIYLIEEKINYNK